MIHVDHISII